MGHVGRPRARYEVLPLGTGALERDDPRRDARPTSRPDEADHPVTAPDEAWDAAFEAFGAVGTVDALRASDAFEASEVAGSARTQRRP